MKKVLMACLASFIIGVIAFVLIPKTEVVHMEASYAHRSEKDLVDLADTIIRGKVKEQLPSKQGAPGLSNLIYTDTIVAVEEIYKGVPYSDLISIRKKGGKVGNVIAIYEYGSFEVEEEVILFLVKDDRGFIDEDYYFTVGGPQGMFHLKENEVGEQIFESRLGRYTLKRSSVKKQIENTMKELEENPITRMTREEIDKANESVFGKKVD